MSVWINTIDKAPDLGALLFFGVWDEGSNAWAKLGSATYVPELKCWVGGAESWEEFPGTHWMTVPRPSVGFRNRPDLPICKATGKLMHKSESAATYAARRLGHHTYQCAECKSWHTANAEAKKQTRTVRRRRK